MQKTIIDMEEGSGSLLWLLDSMDANHKSVSTMEWQALLLALGYIRSKEEREAKEVGRKEDGDRVREVGQLVANDCQSFWFSY